MILIRIEWLMLAGFAATLHGRFTSGVGGERQRAAIGSVASGSTG